MTLKLFSFDQQQKENVRVYLFPVDKEQSERNNESILLFYYKKDEKNGLSVGISLTHSNVKRTEHGPEFFRPKYRY